VLSEITKKRIQNLQQQKQSLIEETISLVQQ
jgi:gas vesicle GvpC-like protein